MCLRRLYDVCSVWTVCVCVVGEVCVVISQTENQKFFFLKKNCPSVFFNTKERTSHMEQKRKACHIPQTFVNSMRNVQVDRKKG